MHVKQSEVKMPQVKPDEIAPDEFHPSTMWVYHDHECPHCGDPAVLPNGYKEKDDEYWFNHWREYERLMDTAYRWQCVGCDVWFSVQEIDGKVVRKVIATFN